MPMRSLSARALARFRIAMAHSRAVDGGPLDECGRDAPGDRGERLARRDRRIRDVIGEAPHDPVRREERRTREDDAELVAADARDDVAGAHARREDLADPDERLVA